MVAVVFKSATPELLANSAQKTTNRFKKGLKGFLCISKDNIWNLSNGAFGFDVKRKLIEFFF